MTRDEMLKTLRELYAGYCYGHPCEDGGVAAQKAIAWLEDKNNAQWWEHDGGSKSEDAAIGWLLK